MQLFGHPVQGRIVSVVSIRMLNPRSTSSRSHHPDDKLRKLIPWAAGPQSPHKGGRQLIQTIDKTNNSNKSSNLNYLYCDFRIICKSAGWPAKSAGGRNRSRHSRKAKSAGAR